MPKSILVGLDESQYSHAAIELSIEWSRRFGSLVVGLGVIDEPAIRGGQRKDHIAASYRGAYDQLVAEATRRVDRILERFTLRCTQAGVPHKLLEDMGCPCEQIMLESQRYDLLLMGQKSFFHFETSGRECETLDRLLHGGPRPVVVAPENAPQGSSVVIAYDGSIQAARALHAFVASGLGGLGSVHIVCSRGDSKLEASKIADRAVEFLRFHEIPATPHVSEDRRSPSDVIMQQAHQLDAQLIVMGAYGRGSVVEFFLGSTTRPRLLAKSDRPLFLYH